MKNTTHYLNCDAPICAKDPNPKHKEEVVWRPGEAVCGKYPYQKFQRKQIDINGWVKKGKFKNVDESYTANDLETRLL